jgi:hypothetical protein
MIKICIVKGCKAPIRNSHLMCPPHWRMVPTGIQIKVYDAASKYKAIDPRKVSNEEFNRVHKQYYYTVKEAIMAVAARGPSFYG